MHSEGNNQVGNSFIMATVTMLVVAALATSSWLIYQNNQTKIAAAASNPNQSTTQQTTTTAHAPTVTYLHIKEWGVKLPLSDAIKDARYVVSTSFPTHPDGLPSGVWLSLNSLADPSCDPATNNAGGTGAIGAILRVSPTYRNPVAPYQLYTDKYPNGVTIGNYYYAYQSWVTNTSCSQKTLSQQADKAFAATAKGTITSATTTN